MRYGNKAIAVNGVSISMFYPGLRLNIHPVIVPPRPDGEQVLAFVTAGSQGRGVRRRAEFFAQHCLYSLRNYGGGGTIGNIVNIVNAKKGIAGKLGGNGGGPIGKNILGLALILAPGSPSRTALS